MENREIIHSLICTNRWHKKVVDNVASGLKLHRSQHHLLMLLSRKDKSLSQECIAKRLEISPAALSVKMKKLESEGYISRERDGEDNRINSVKITEKGLAVTEATKEAFDEIDKRALEGISERELEVFLSVLGRMRENYKLIDAMKGESEN